MAIRLFVYTFSFILLLTNCKSNEDKKELKKVNKFEEAKNKFEEAKNKFEDCKTDYEKSYNHKIVVSVRNGSGVPGAAKQVSDYLRSICYDTYYDNWDINNQFESKIILHKQDSKLGKQLKKDLDNRISIENILDFSQGIDATFVIGQNYNQLSFYKELQK